MSEHSIQVLPTPQALAEEAARRVAQGVQSTDAKDAVFTIFLAGGSTPRALYKLLAAEPYKSSVMWSKLEVFWGDERCVPFEHPDSNARMADETWLSQVPIPRERIHRMRGEVDPQAAAAEYDDLLQQRFRDFDPDLVLLGMGDDGHTASLFPGTEALKETERFCVPNYVEKLNAWRLTLTAPFINRAHAVMVLVAGAGKAQRLTEVLEGPRDPQRLPIQLIRPRAGALTWLIDAAAAGMDDAE